MFITGEEDIGGEGGLWMVAFAMPILGEAAVGIFLTEYNKMRNKKLSKKERKISAYRILQTPIKQFLLDLDLRDRLGVTNESTKKYRICQTAYKFYEELVTAIVATEELVEEKTIEDAKTSASHIANAFDQLPFGVPNEKYSFDTNVDRILPYIQNLRLESEEAPSVKHLLDRIEKEIRELEK